MVATTPVQQMGDPAPPPHGFVRRCGGSAGRGALFATSGARSHNPTLHHHHHHTVSAGVAERKLQCYWKSSLQCGQFRARIGKSDRSENYRYWTSAIQLGEYCKFDHAAANLLEIRGHSAPR